jgi:type I restriction enzyme R subunit
MTTDISEHALESIIVADLTSAGGHILGASKDYDRAHAVDTVQLLAFLSATQPATVAKLKLAQEGHARTDFLGRLQTEVAKRGVIDVFRRGVHHLSDHVRLYAPRPTPGNVDAEARFAANRFTVTRQLHYSPDDTQRALDLALSVNGLPLVTFELKNSLTSSNYRDAIVQYQKTRSPKELLFQFKRCLVHFAVDDQEAWMCTRLQNGKSWFLPFNKGYQQGAGNPPNPNGIATDYLWKEVLSRDSLCEIIEQFAQLVHEKRADGKTVERLVFPRYHQRDVVRRLVVDARATGIGQRYLIQHSAGSGKSNSIAWVAHQLVGLQHAGETLFDTVIVVTDRRVLDRQLRQNIQDFSPAPNLVGVATKSDELAAFLEGGKKIITTTVQKFPHVLDLLGASYGSRRFALLIDEAHSGQGGNTMEDMHTALSRGLDDEAGEDADDYEEMVLREIKKRKLLANASYFAFTATPKNKTEEMFGIPYAEGGKTKFRAFHVYSMKQAIEEDFIKDVLANYTPVNSWYELAKAVEGDPKFEVKKAQKKLRAFVENNDRSVASKAEVMIDHFLDEVIARKKVGGEARAMVVTASIRRAIAYKVAFDRHLKVIASPYKAIVAFSGAHELTREELGLDGEGKETVDEAKLNGFPSVEIPDRFREGAYRFLIAADKFQTGFDEPLLYAMYVDKPLSGAKAVQTLSRLNRAHPLKDNPYVLDFVNDEATIQEAFQRYYTTTVLTGRTDPNKLHDLKDALDGRAVYEWYQVQTVVKLFLEGASREKLDPTLDACAAVYKALDEAGQVDFKASAKAFVRTYNFLGTVLTFAVPAWEELAIFLTLLLPKLPTPKEDDLAKGITDTVDLESYRTEVLAKRSIALKAEDGEIEPVPTGGGAGKPDPEMEYLSKIVQQFNDLFGNLDWKDKPAIEKLVVEEIPKKVAQNTDYQNALKNADKQNALIQHDKALEETLVDLVTDHAELFKLWMEPGGFREFLSKHSFEATKRILGEKKVA